MNTPICITATAFLEEKHSAIPDLKNSVIQKIKQGGSLVFPTETIYGLGATALDAPAVAALFTIKGRSPQKPPPVIVGNYDQLLQLVSAIPPHAKFLMDQYWPGALTIIFPARDSLPEIICGKNILEGKEISTIAVRMTSSLLAKKLCEETGTPLVATSANFSEATGRAAAPRTLQDIPESFLQKVDVVIDGQAEAGEASTIVDCTVFPARVLRKGAIELSEDDLSG